MQARCTRPLGTGHQRVSAPGTHWPKERGNARAGRERRLFFNQGEATSWGSQRRKKYLTDPIHPGWTCLLWPRLATDTPRGGHHGTDDTRKVYEETGRVLAVVDAQLIGGHPSQYLGE